jgi:hypothetical protein
MVVTVGAYAWSSTADRGGPLSASHACAETSMWDSVPLPGPRRGRLEVRCVTLTVPADDAGPGRGSLGVAMIRVRPADQPDRIGSLVLYGGAALARALGPSANSLTVSRGGRTALERSRCVAQQAALYLVEVRVPGGHAC